MNSDAKVRSLRVVVITASLLVLLFVGLYLWAINSESYKHCLTFTRGKREIAEVIGSVEKQHLAFLGPYYERTNGSEGHANYKIIVQGTKDSGNLFLVMKQHEGKWSVVYGKLVYGGGKTLFLSPES